MNILFARVVQILVGVHMHRMARFANKMTIVCGNSVCVCGNLVKCHLFIYLFVHSFIHLFIYLYIHIHVYLFVVCRANLAVLKEATALASPLVQLKEVQGIKSVIS